MSSVQNNTYHKSDDQLLIMQDIIESKMQDYYEKMKKLTEDLTAIITSIMDQINISKSSPDKKGSLKAQDTTTVVPDNRKDPPLEGGHYTKLRAFQNSIMRSVHHNYMN